jgi:hypothetical protein
MGNILCILMLKQVVYTVTIMLNKNKVILCIIMSRIRGSVTDNNGFWIG